MDFENCDAFIIPFSFNEKSAWKQVLGYLSEDKTTPVAAVCHSRVVSIDIEKEYFPVEYIDINFIAKWNAVSIFIESWTEKETHYEPQIHYFDRFGEEHDHPGFDYWDERAKRWKSGVVHPIKSRKKGYRGEARTIAWQPQEVHVEVTENISYERETGREKTSGEIKDQHAFHHVGDYPFSASHVVDEKIPYSDEIIKDGKVIKPENPINKEIFDLELDKARAKAKQLCIKKIPGEDYKDFNMDFDFKTTCQILYYPVYHVIYEFLGQDYECFISGYQSNVIKGKLTPEDLTIENEMHPYDSQISNLEAQKKECKNKYFKIRLIIVGVCLLGLELFVSFQHFFLAFLLLCGATVPFIYLGRIKNGKVKELDQEIAKYNVEKSNIIQMRQAKKAMLLNTLLDDSLSDGERTARCEEILKGGGGG